jgi:HSP20 family protein
MLLARRNNNQNWLNNWFDDDFFDTALMPRMNATAPAVNVKETAEDYTMEVAVPGLKKEWVRVNIDNEGNLKLAIENKFEHKEENKDGKKSDEKHVHYLRREFSYSNYEQTYVLPDDVDRNKISAKVADGVLTVVIPKEVKEEQKTLKNIEVK